MQSIANRQIGKSSPKVRSYEASTEVNVFIAENIWVF